METKIQDQLQGIIQRRIGATRLDNLIHGYRLYARTEGKSPKTIRITTTAVTTLRDFLEAKGFSTDVTEISTQELRELILHLQQVKAFEHHHYTRPQPKGLSGHTINCYLRAVRAFWSWLIHEEVIVSNPFAKVRIPKPPKKVIPTFSESQIQALLGVIHTSTSAGFRDWRCVLTSTNIGAQHT